MKQSLLDQLENPPGAEHREQGQAWGLMKAQLQSTRGTGKDFNVNWKKYPWKGLEWEFLHLSVLVASEGVQERVLAATSRAAIVPPVNGAQDSALCWAGAQGCNPGLERAGTAATPEHPTAPAGSPRPISVGSGCPLLQELPSVPKEEPPGCSC